MQLLSVCSNVCVLMDPEGYAVWLYTYYMLAVYLTNTGRIVSGALQVRQETGQ